MENVKQSIFTVYKIYFETYFFEQLFKLEFNF